MEMQGTCEHCDMVESDLKKIAVVRKLTRPPSIIYMCRRCRNTCKFWYFDEEENCLRFNKVTTYTESTLTQGNKHNE